MKLLCFILASSWSSPIPFIAEFCTAIWQSCIRSKIMVFCICQGLKVQWEKVESLKPHHNKAENLTGPQGRPIKPSSHIHQKGDHELDFTGCNCTKAKANIMILRITIKTDRIDRKGRKSVILVDIAAFKRGKKILRHANTITCNIKMCSYCYLL